MLPPNPEIPPHADPPRKRGAQKGNQNAYKHGFYTRLVSPQDNPPPPPGQGRLQGDIKLFKVIIARLISGLADGSSLPDTFPGNLAILQVVSVAVARLNSLCATNKRLFTGSDSESIEMFKRFGLTDKEIQEELAQCNGLPQGAQRGNRNALSTVPTPPSLTATCCEN
jgi:hypothetical protein